MVYTLTFYNSQMSSNQVHCYGLADTFLHLDMQFNLQTIRIRPQYSELRSIVPSCGALILCTCRRAADLVELMIQIRQSGLYMSWRI